MTWCRLHGLSRLISSQATEYPSFLFVLPNPQTYRKPRVPDIEASCFDVYLFLPSMFSVKQFMEEGFKFIIPPPKYHSFPNLLPLVDSSFLSDKMAADSPYHRLPEDNRPSMDSTPGDDQRLIDSDPLYDDDEPAPPKKGAFNIKLSYHPTFYLRLLALCLLISAFGIFTAAASRHSNAIPSIVFIGIAILRNIVVLYFHLVGYSLIRIHIEIAGRTTSTSSSQPKKWRPSVL